MSNSLPTYELRSSIGSLHRYEQRSSMAACLPPLLVSSHNIPFNRSMPLDTFFPHRSPSLNSNQGKYPCYGNGWPSEQYSSSVISQDRNIAGVSLSSSSRNVFPERAKEERSDFLTHYPYRPSTEYIPMSGSNNSLRYRRGLSKCAAQPSSKSTAYNIHFDSAASTPPRSYNTKSCGDEMLKDTRCSAGSSSDGYATGSSNRSCTSGENAVKRNHLLFSNSSQNFESGGCLIANLPPPAYADTPPEEGYTTRHDQETFPTQNSDETVSDFFSQSEKCSDSSEETPPRASEPNFSSQDSGDMMLLKQAQHSSDVTQVTKDGDGHLVSLPRLSMMPNASTMSSPIAKRGRFISSCDNPTVSIGHTASNKQSSKLQRYYSEYSNETYIWLSYKAKNTYAIGPLFMSAQKASGASCKDRRLVLLKATSEMKKRKHTLEAIHLGAYIMDKCLDSFHVSKHALADVCAVSMVLGTKMEEYDSLQPGTVNGLVGATKDKTRLCDIEKRIVYEMTDGLCFPTPLVFANYMLVELRCNDEQISFAHYLLNLALLNSRFRDVEAPKVAHAAVCISSAVVSNRDSSFESECHALQQAEQNLVELTKFPIGSTRDVMRGLMYEMAWAVQERHSILIDYLSEDNKRVCFCECSPALWNLICGVRSGLYVSRRTELELEISRV